MFCHSDQSGSAKLIFVSILIYETGAPGATFCFPNRLAVRAEIFMRLVAPVKSAGELIVLLPRGLVIHFFAAQVAARKLKVGRGFGIAHNLISYLTKSIQ